MSAPRRPAPATRLVLVAALASALAACGGGTTPAATTRSTASATPGATGSTVSTTPVSVPGTPARPAGQTQDATLVRVVDGDTIRVVVVGVEERVRYIGIDTPELNTTSPATPDPFAESATDANARLLAGGRIVLERDVSERDQYGRLLRNIWVERDGAWTFVNLALVAEGYARVSTYPPDVRYADVLLAAQRTARETSRGLWGATPP